MARRAPSLTRAKASHTMSSVKTAFWSTGPSPSPAFFITRPLSSSVFPLSCSSLRPFMYDSRALILSSFCSYLLRHASEGSPLNILVKSSKKLALGAGANALLDPWPWRPGAPKPALCPVRGPKDRTLLTTRRLLLPPTTGAETRGALTLSALPSIPFTRTHTYARAHSSSLRRRGPPRALALCLAFSSSSSPRP